MHPQAHTNFGILLLSILFGVAIGAFVLVGMFTATFVLVNFLTGIIQTVFPQFMQPKRSVVDGESSAETRAATRKIALDFVLAERRKRESANITRQEFGAFKAEIEKRLRLTIAGHITSEDMQKVSEEWTLDALQQVAKGGKPQTSQADKDLISQARFHLLKFPDGPKNPPRYLCASSGHGDTLRRAFAHVRSKSIRMDYASAHRLAATIPGVFVAPANAAARLWVRGKSNLKTEGKTHAATA
jgi:hypothetical protein